MIKYLGKIDLYHKINSRGYMLISRNAEGVYVHLYNMRKGYTIRERLGTPGLA